MPGLRLVAELGGDGSGFEAMMNRAHGRTRQFASQAIAPLKNLIVGAFTVGAISSFSNKVIQFGSHLRDVADRLGVNVEWLQETGFAAKQAGADMDKLAAFLERVAQARNDALNDPKGRTAQAFQQLGVGGEQLRAGSLQTLFDQIAKAFQGGATQQLLPAIREVGGRGGGQLVAAFVQGIEENRQLARDAGVVMSDETVDALKLIADEFTTLGHTLMTGFAPAILAAAEAAQTAFGLLQQTGKGSEGFLSNFLAKFSERDSGWKGFWKGVADGLEAGWEGFQHDVVSEEADQRNRADAAALARDRMAAFRKERERNPETFDDFGTARGGATKQRAPSLPTDEYARIGAILGHNPALVNTIANQQVKLASDHLDVARRTLRAVENLQSPNHETLSFPGL